MWSPPINYTLDFVNHVPEETPDMFELAPEPPEPVAPQPRLVFVQGAPKPCYFCTKITDIKLSVDARYSFTTHSECWSTWGRTGNK